VAARNIGNLRGLPYNLDHFARDLPPAWGASSLDGEGLDHYKQGEKQAARELKFWNAFAVTDE
jgi:hypothetical protein